MSSNLCRSQEKSENLVFCIKEIRALLGLCDQVEDIVDLLLLFCDTGSPIKFSTQTSAFTVSLIMATLEERHIQTQQHRTERERAVEQDERRNKRSRGDVVEGGGHGMDGED